MRRAAVMAGAVTVVAALVVAAVLALTSRRHSAATRQRAVPSAGAESASPASIDYSSLPRDPMVPVLGWVTDIKVGPAVQTPSPTPLGAVSVPWQFLGQNGSQLQARVPGGGCLRFLGFHVIQTGSDVVLTALDLPSPPGTPCPPSRAYRASATLSAPLGNRALRHADVTDDGYASVLTLNDPVTRTPTFTPVISARRARGLVTIGWDPVSVSPDGRQLTVQVLPFQPPQCLEQVSFELTESSTSVVLGAYGRAWNGDCLTGAPRFTIALAAPLDLRALLHPYVDEPGYQQHQEPPIPAPTASDLSTSGGGAGAEPGAVSAGWSEVGEDPLRITVVIYYPACYLLDGFEVGQDRDAVQLRMLIRMRPPTPEPMSCGLPATLIEQIYLDKPLGNRPLLHAYVPAVGQPANG